MLSSPSVLVTMLDYNVLGGKLNRGLAVVESYKLLKAGSEPNEEEHFLACILGWGIEWLQAYFLVLDDIMDNSQTRRGKPCWYRLPKVGLIAINDGLVLHSQISRIFKRYFYGKPYYVDLLDLFNEVEFRTTSGELLDQITTSEGHKDLSKYTVDVYGLIVEYKTAYYSFYLAVGCALLPSGKNLDDYVQAKRILVEMGVYFQIQDDYLDSFGDPEVLGKIGTDIEDFKCSWLFVQALVRVDERQKDILFENYGKSDPACVAKVKALYKELNLERVFSEYERETYEKLISHIKAQPNEAVQAVLESFLHKIHMRK
ncbi:farnesyl pyrophosphate synthase-like [Hordeum vulgare subsp. vulgare]|uniref:farnesyl pyrophosphate synthase-like n=1 Tax=Hordeum vulgare subsp. vulgare TaxID=112509 RepID=UPI001D1A5806|nr:farnesyl pyrophosphate synthase-like [Hordeum vulgare subsp. vulgare]